jgi:hypothetical protein
LRVSLIPEGDNNIVPAFNNINALYMTPENIQAHSTCQPIYECINKKQLINFYYATMGYPVIDTWCKNIDKGYF